MRARKLREDGHAGQAWAKMSKAHLATPLVMTVCSGLALIACLPAASNQRTSTSTPSPIVEEAPPARARVKDIVGHRASYRNAFYARSNLRPGVLASFVVEHAVVPSSTDLVVVYRCQLEVNGQKTMLAEHEHHHQRGDGLDRIESETLLNNIPIYANLQINYLGLVPVLEQGINYSEELAEPPNELLYVESVPSGLASARSDTHYEMKGRWQYMDGKHRPGPLDFLMTTKQVGPASKIAPSLTGDAVPIEVEIKNANGITTARRDFYYLADYGVALLVHSERTSGSLTCAVASVAIDGTKAEPAPRSASLVLPATAFSSSAGARRLPWTSRRGRW
jgi:hypothetical protein